MAERAIVVTYDRAGVGRSGGSQARTVTEMTDDLHRLLRALHLELPAVFVGWSYGGLVTQSYATRYPSDVAGLVFVDPTASGTPPGSALVRDLSFLLAPRLRTGGGKAVQAAHLPADVDTGRHLADSQRRHGAGRRRLTSETEFADGRGSAPARADATTAIRPGRSITPGTPS